jgi:hypothetical protein
MPFGTLGGGFGHLGGTGQGGNSAPANTVAPVLSGTPTQGQTLSVTTGTWTGTATITYAYQCYDALDDGSGHVLTDGSGNPLGTPIGGATSSTYVLAAGDVGSFIFWVVTATNSIGSAIAYSNVTATQVVSGTTTLNPLDKTTDIGLSPGNLTATQNDALGFYGGVRTIASASSGKKYWEFHADTIITSASSIVEGVANSTAALNVGAFLGQTADSIGWVGSGQILMNNAVQVTIQTWAQGDTLCFALDLDHMRLWCRTNGGNWNNDILANQNPATHTGGIDISGLATGPYFAALQLKIQNDIMTANFGGSAYAQAVPIGFGNL